ncbi:SPOSA6832_01681 [Sporobolomyces salmonicolor]|uniref:GDP-Man:Man(3)GlcNAc(2)-PP-Dol alpha-1,2-mannosyltransferase n=1 Tax=Sporidiobolus salmonicolor TaxID=5005 RepID=A0A0D6EK21_SPOSA|nr:SPOSA6832_01681 [Sporobolomyces salmonicolor]
MSSVWLSSVDPSLLALLLLLPLIPCIIASLLISLARLSLRSTRSQQRDALFRSLGLGLVNQRGQPRRVVGFFHPYCNAGGGGERVLWTALACMQRRDEDGDVYVVYTGDTGVNKDDMLARVQNRFGITLSHDTLAFIPLRRRYLVEDSTWPRFTLLGQSLGSVLLACEALRGREGVVPDVWIGEWVSEAMLRERADGSMRADRHHGLCVCLSVDQAYVPYPRRQLHALSDNQVRPRYLLHSRRPALTMRFLSGSADMLRRVELRQAGHTNPSHVARSWVLSTLKLWYYRLFALLYSSCLAQADVIMVNSTWTKRHIDRLLLGESAASEEEKDQASSHLDGVASSSAATSASRLRQRRLSPPSSSPSLSRPSSRPRPRPCTRTHLLYPPCSTASFSSFPLSETSRSPRTILSLAQFRPEKEHPLQLHSLAKLFSLHPEFRSDVKLTLAGSVRNEDDSRRVDELKKLAKDLGVDGNVEWRVNVPFEQLLGLLSNAGVGLHTMVDEHFGITMVEFQAAGLITLAHASAGPLLDIIVPYSPPSPSSLPPGPTGFLAPPPSSSFSRSSAPPELPAAFARQLAHILLLSEQEQREIRERARMSAVERFGAEVFERGWMTAWDELVGQGR